MKKMKKYIIGIVVLVIVGLVIKSVVANLGSSEELDTNEVIHKQVQVQEIIRQNEINSSLVASGTVTPKEYSLVRSLVPGTIEYLAPVGSEVYIGQPLFSIRDANIENNYFNALQNLEQTRVLTNQRVQQAELGLNSVKARLDLVRSQLSNVTAQTQQNTITVENSAVVTYNSAYNLLVQTFNFLVQGNLDEEDITASDYVYYTLPTTYSQLKNDVLEYLPLAIQQFNSLEYPVTNNNLESNLNSLNNTLTSVKNIVDNTQIILNNSLSQAPTWTETRIEADKVINAGFQTQINLATSNVITAVNNISNTKINNRLSIEQAQNQVDLTQIEYNNTELALANAREGASLEMNAAQNRLDVASYSFNNLTLAAPFSGTVISHYTNAGEQANIGQELIELGNLSISEIVVDVDVLFAKAIKLNDPVTINDKFTGLVSEIEPIGDLTTGKVSITVQTDASGDDLTPGSVADVKFNLSYQAENVIVIPIKNVTIEASGNYVFVVEDNIVKRKQVVLDQIYGDQVTIAGGLVEGDHLVLLNGVFVSDGDEVEVIE